MEIAIQIILVATVIAVAIYGGKNGFIKSFGVFAKYVGSYFAANSLYRGVSAMIDKIGFIADMKGGMQSAAALEGKTGFFETVISSIGALAGGTSPADERSFIIGNLISIAISFTALFFAFFFVMKLITWLIGKKIENKKVLKVVNVIAGVLVGIAIGCVVAWAAAKSIVTFAVPFVSEKLPEANMPDIASLPVVGALFKLDGVMTIFS